MSVFIITEYRHEQAYIRKVVNGNCSVAQLKAIMAELANEAVLNTWESSYFDYDERPVE